MIDKEMKNKKGFTLIELLIVIAIIGILAGVVMVSTQGAVEKSRKASALTTAASALPELATCQDDGGIATATVPSASKYICCSDSNCTTGAPGHTAMWPNITSNTGWVYDVPTAGKSLANGDYEYKLKNAAGTAFITCSLATNGCE